MNAFPSRVKTYVDEPLYVIIIKAIQKYYFI